VEPAAIVFFAAASATASLHALIPDHWLPFVLMGRARNWTTGKTLALASASGLVHVFLAVGLGLVTYRLGRDGAEVLARRIGETLEVLSSLSLAVFGIVYGGYSWYRERRHHPDPDILEASGSPPPGTHHHGHLLENWFSGDPTGLSLVIVIGVSPCALAFPILLASAATLGVSGVLLVATGFGVATMATTLAITLIAFLSSRKIDFPFLARYGDLTSGILIGVVGLLLFISEVSGG